jgi:chromosome segregation ATPase
MGLFKKRVDPSDLEELRSEIASMGARLEAADAAKHQLGQRVEGLASRLDTPVAPVTPLPTEPPPPPAPTVDPAEIDKLNARIERLSNRLDEVDQRVTAIATELANQISEIAGELDAREGGEPVDHQVLDVLRDAQTRLANEQARYQIAFRQDLADLVERLRKA